MLDEGTCLAVGIVVERSTTIVCEVVEILVCLHTISQTRQYKTRIAADDAALYLNASIGIDCINKVGSEVEIVRFHFLSLDNGEASAAATTYFALMFTLTYDGVVKTDGTVLIQYERGLQCLVFQIVQSVGIPLLVHPVIVIDRGTQSIELRTLSGQEDVVSVIVELLDDTCLVVKGHFETIARDGAQVPLAIHFQFFAFHLHGCNILPSGSTLHGQLLVHLHVAFLAPRLVFLQAELYVQEILATGFHSCEVDRQCDGLSFTWSHADIIQLARLIISGCTIFFHSPAQVVFGKVGEIVLVENLYLSFLDILSRNLHILVHLLYLVVLRLRLQIGQHDAVHAEHTVVGFVAVVTTIAKELCTIWFVGVDSLVHPVPNGTAAEEVGAFDSLPVVNQITHGVTHRMRVFRNMVWIFHTSLSLNGIAHPFD